jgi:predicted nucleic acid-binding protein
MTVALDTSALLAAHLATPSRRTVRDALRQDPSWCASALALAEALAALDRLTDEPVLRADLEDQLRLTWDRCYVVPVDQRCLDRAAELCRSQPLRMADGIHLAAADRLTRPVRFVTLDPAQIPVALSLGFDVVSS